MQFHKPTADFFVPDGIAPDAAISRTTHLCLSAHQDDIEIMAYHGVAECFGQKDKWFTGVVVTNGAGSPRTGIYGDYTDEEMQKPCEPIGREKFRLPGRGEDSGGERRGCEEPHHHGGKRRKLENSGNA